MSPLTQSVTQLTLCNCTDRHRSTYTLPVDLCGTDTQRGLSPTGLPTTPPTSCISWVWAFDFPRAVDIFSAIFLSSMFSMWDLRWIEISAVGLGKPVTQSHSRSCSARYPHTGVYSFVCVHLCFKSPLRDQCIKTLRKHNDSCRWGQERTRRRWRVWNGALPAGVVSGRASLRTCSTRPGGACARYVHFVHGWESLPKVRIRLPKCTFSKVAHPHDHLSKTSWWHCQCLQCFLNGWATVQTPEF